MSDAQSASTNGNTGANANGGEGSVNFDAGLVKQGAANEQQAVNAAPEPVVTLNSTAPKAEAAPTTEVAAPAAEPDGLIHRLGVVLMVTVNRGRPVMEGLKDLKNVSIEEAGQSRAWNFYNPFRRANAEQQSGEGVIRQVFGQIAALAGTILEKPLYLEDESKMPAKVDAIAKQLAYSVERKFPLRPTQQVIEVEVEVGEAENDGEDAPTEVLHFGDMFRVETWASVSEEDGIVTHNIYLNLIIEAAAFYDSREPHKFVEQAFNAIQSALIKLELEIPAYFAVSFDASTLGDETTRDMFTILMDEGGYSLISLGHVMLGKEQEWVKPADGAKLFGSGSDLMLFRALHEEEEEVDEDEAGDEDEEDDEELLDDEDGEDDDE